MKQTLLYFLLCLSLTGFAQDWAPFKTTDTIRHYSSKWQSVMSPIPMHNQIQSVVVQSRLSGNQLVFKKGYTQLQPISIYQQAVKGQIFGDTMIVDSNSTRFHTSAVNGFSLIFPRKFTLNQVFTFGIAANNIQLIATVDSIFVDSVENTQDSLARFYLTYSDSNGVDTTSDYHYKNVIISKSNGMLVGIDFTNLWDVITVKQYFTDKHYITNSEHYSLTVGDEYHFSDITTLNGFSDYYNTSVKVRSDTIIGVQRTLSFEVNRRKTNPPPSGPLVSSFFNTSFDNSELFAVFESQIIEDSIFNSGFPSSFNSLIQTQNFYLCDNCGFNKLGLNVDSTNYDLPFNFVTGKRDSLFHGGSVSNYWQFDMIGVGDYGYYGFQNMNSSRKSIFYVKKGNQSWGTPLNLSVGLEEVSQAGVLNVYPNPASNQLQIDTEQSVKSILISDINGKAVEANRSNKIIDISNLSSGLYFIRVETEKGIFREKFVKKR